MTMNEPNRFRFHASARLPGVTALSAVMADFSYVRHAHEEIALGVTLAGRQDFKCLGRHHKSEPGQVMLFNPGDVHDGNPGGKATLQYAMLYLDPERFWPLVGCVAEDARIPERFAHTHFKDHALGSLILDLCGRMAQGTCSSMEYEWFTYAMAERLAVRMRRFKPAETARCKDALLLKARDCMHEHFAEDLSIEDLSRVAGMSKYHFIRLFRDQFGLPPHKYLQNHRVNRVRAAIAQGAAPTRAAQDCGFFDVSHMNRHFKRVYGLTPRQFQAQCAPEPGPC